MARSQVVKPVKTLWRLLLQKRLLYCIFPILWIILNILICIFTTEWTFTMNTRIEIYIFPDGRPLLWGNHTKIPHKSNGLTYGLCGSMLKNLMSNRCNVNVQLESAFRSRVQVLSENIITGLFVSWTCFLMTGFCQREREREREREMRYPWRNLENDKITDIQPSLSVTTVLKEGL